MKETLRSTLKFSQIAFPLMINSFSHSFMILADRIMISKISLNAMNSIVFIGTLLFIFESFATSVTVTSEVFSGQYNGAKKYKLAPSASWQMIYISILYGVLMIPFALYSSDILILDEYKANGENFYKIMMFSIFLSPAIASINGFFVGIKKTRIISINALICNILNIFLNYIFIFGIEGIIKPLGTTGAAIGTSISLMIQFIIILSFFLKKRFRDIYGTSNFKFNKKIMLNCLFIGIPSGIAMVTEIIANYLMLSFVTKFTPQYLSNNSIGLNFLLAIIFVMNGIYKATSGVAANIIGENKPTKLNKLVLSSTLLYSSFTITISILTYIFRYDIAHIFTNDIRVIELLMITLPVVILYFFIDGIYWSISGILISGGDTKFVLIATILITIFTKILPSYFILSSNFTTANMPWIISCFSSFISLIIFFVRYKKYDWIKMNVNN